MSFMKKIGKYEVCGLLGKGGMGTVYKVRMPIIGKVVALKQLKPHPYLVSLLGMEKVREQFVTEAVTMARLRHPNIVAIWDFYDDKDLTFFCMEYYCHNLGAIIGETYRLEAPSRQLGVDRAIDYTRQALIGLSRLHHAGIVHRDIKPFNLLVTEQNQIKITDFGLSKLRGESFEGPKNLIVGTPYYAAPEQERDPNAADLRADLYAVGVILYRMLTGELPMDSAKKLQEVNPDLDRSWDRFFEKSTALNRDKRFESAEDMLQALHQLERDWEEKKARVCQTPQLFQSPGRDNTNAASMPRGKGIKVSPKKARALFGLDDRWRPLNFVENDFTKADDGTVTDNATHLVWQQAGSDHPVTWHEAAEYVAYLNAIAFAGRATWRLPSIEELISLLTDVPRTGDLCMEPVFDQSQRWLWSVDRRSFVAAWYVSVELGYVAWQDFSCYHYVRAVSTFS